jgi:protein-L-isoaspartate(D-aspartate) O-methyltransferase
MDTTSSIRELQDHLYREVSSYRPVRGDIVPITPEMAEAFYKTPRHKFVDRFRLAGVTSGPVFDASDNSSLLQIYKNQPLMYVDNEGRSLNASSSEPAFILHLLSLLDIKPGMKVLEIGCGTGWLLAIIANLVGSDGVAVGVEIEPALAQMASRNLAEIDNASVVLANGNSFESDAKFDRVMITASTYMVPKVAISSLKENGKIVIPLRNRGLAEEAFVFDKGGTQLFSTQSRLCKFVEMVSVNQSNDLAGLKPIPLTGPVGELLRHPNDKFSFPLSDNSAQNELYAALPFSSFLSKTESNFVGYTKNLSNWGQSFQEAVFGNAQTLCLAIVDESAKSAALWSGGELAIFGSSDAADSFRTAFHRWQKVGRPDGTSFSLTISFLDRAILPTKKTPDVRGNQLFEWKLKDSSGVRE